MTFQRQPIYSLTAEVLGRPIAWARATGKQGKRYTPQRNRDYATLLAGTFALKAGFRQFPGEVAVTIDIRADRVEVGIVAIDPDDTRRALTGLTGDIDNYAKAVLDALEKANVITNDRAVAELRVRFRPDREESP